MMACTTSYELHHNFPKLAEEAGFAFNTHKPRVHIDWNKIRFLDLDSLIRDRKFVVIEQHVNDILDCVLESEFDVRILDEGVLKMFRLAQLAVEYQQFCRRYLDRSVHLLREELTSLTQELNSTRRLIREKEDELRKLKRKPKHGLKPSILYGNENIASMILKTLSNKSEPFPSTSMGDTTHQYNKCNHCDKVFLNQLYLQSHISRRHSNVMQVPEKDSTGNEEPEGRTSDANEKLSNEISELKCKLKEMESLITVGNIKNNKVEEAIMEPIKTREIATQDNIMKEAEVSTFDDSHILEKIEEWKREEHEKHEKEIQSLRNQIIESINSIKKTETQTSNAKENELFEKLNKTILDQGAQILALKQELQKSKLDTEEKHDSKNNETEVQMLMWMKKAEAQAKQYEKLVENLNIVAKEAKEARSLAEKESEKADRLQALLEKQTHNVHEQTRLSRNDNNPPINCNSVNPIQEKSITTKETKKKQVLDSKIQNHSHPKPERRSLEELHRKAQELLNMKSSSSSEVSSLSEDSPTQEKLMSVTLDDAKNEKNKKSYVQPNHDRVGKLTNGHKRSTSKLKKEKSKSSNHIDIRKENGPIAPKSPKKVVRAKITERVNNNLVAAGVDPLKTGLPQNVFQKHRAFLQQEQRLKAKKNPQFEKVRHKLLAYLDSKAGTENENFVQKTDDDVSPSKMTKAFSLTSMISNVKNKAMSFVKSNDMGVKKERQYLNEEVAKRAMSLLKTPPSSPPAPKKHLAGQRYLQETNRNQSTNRYYEVTSSAYPNKNIEKYNKKKQIKIETKTTNKEIDDDTDEETNSTSENEQNKKKTSKSIESLIKSPVRRPATATDNYQYVKTAIGTKGTTLPRAQSDIDLTEVKNKENMKSGKSTNLEMHTDNSSDDDRALAKVMTSPKIKFASSDDILNIVGPKGVLKNAPSTSSLNKKKVLFDMDAIQMKSVSASPSQSLTEKSDTNENFELGIVNIDDEEWDISSIDNEPLKNDLGEHKINIPARTSPKIAELKHTIEAQLARRNETPSTMVIGGVDVLRGPTARAASIGGSNTSLGSSVFDDTDPGAEVEITPKLNFKPKARAKTDDKNDSELDISEFSIDGLIKNKGSF